MFNDEGFFKGCLQKKIKSVEIFHKGGGKKSVEILHTFHIFFLKASLIFIYLFCGVDAAKDKF